MRKAEILGKAPLSEALLHRLYIPDIRASLTDGGSRRTTPNRKHKPVMGDGPCQLNMFNHHVRYQPASCPFHPVTLSPCHPVTLSRYNVVLIRHSHWINLLPALLAFHPSNGRLNLIYNQPGIYGSDSLFQPIFFSYWIETAPAPAKIIVGGI